MCKAATAARRPDRSSGQSTDSGDHTPAIAGHVPPILTDLDGVAYLLNVSRRHAATLDASGRLPAPVFLGRSKRWSVRELEEFIAAGCPSRDRWVAMKRAND